MCAALSGAVGMLVAFGYITCAALFCSAMQLLQQLLQQLRQRQQPMLQLRAQLGEHIADMQSSILNKVRDSQDELDREIFKVMQAVESVGRLVVNSRGDGRPRPTNQGPTNQGPTNQGPTNQGSTNQGFATKMSIGG